MKKVMVYVSDMTLCQEKQGTALSFKEKLEISRHLDMLRTDVIEFGELKDEKTDALLLKTISSFLNHSTLSLSVGKNADPAQCFSLIAKAKKPRLSVALPVSPVQMEYLYHMKAPKMQNFIKEKISQCSSVCAENEFVALDATRAEYDVLVSMLSVAAQAGAKIITLADSAGILMPYEFAAFVKKIKEDVPELSDLRLGVICSDKLHLSSACAISAVDAGACEVKVSVTDGEIPSYEYFADILRDRGEELSLSSSVKFTELKRITSQISWIANSKRSPMTVFDSIPTEHFDSGDIALSSDDDLRAVIAAVKKLGYDLSDEDNMRVYETVQRTAEKKAVGSKELDAIVASTALQVAPTYKLVSYVVNCGNVVTASAHVKLMKDNKELQGICLGDGPIDASFLAIEQITGHHYELDDFQIQSVTEGHEALGSALIKLRSGGKLYSGRGISTDIINSCIHAYLNALNKIAYEEN